jgi:capsular polysaccharide transport system permease protein
MHRCNTSHLERMMSTADSANQSPPVPPALEPPIGRISGHRRSFATARVVFALVLREMSTTYGRSPGGYLWAIVEPVGMILVLSVGFSLLMRSPSLGNNFIVYYASGYLVFAHFRTLEKAVTKSISFSRSLLLYPAVSWLDALVARFILTVLTNTLNTIVIFSGALYLTGTRTVLDFPPMIEAMALATVLGLGVGTFNCMMSGLFPLWTSLWKIVTRPLMIASAVLYIYEDLPAAAGNILWWNPLAHLTGLFRTGVFPTYYPQYITPAYVLAIGMSALVVGLFFLNAYSSDVINRE